MPRADRTIAHELARHYHVATIEIGAEPNRSVHLHTDKCEWPSVRASDAAAASNHPSAGSCTAMLREPLPEAEVTEDCCNRAEPTRLSFASAHMHVDEPLKPKPWRSPTVMAKAAGEAPIGVRSSGAHAATRDGGGNNDVTSGTANVPFSGQQLLSWNAIRRLFGSTFKTTIFTLEYGWANKV